MFICFSSFSSLFYLIYIYHMTQSKHNNLRSRDKERKHWNLLLDKRSTRRSRMAPQNGALSQIEATASRRIDVHSLVNPRWTLAIHNLLAVIDEDVHTAMSLKDYMRSLSRVKAYARIINDEDIGTQPAYRQIPRSNMLVIESMNPSVSKDASENHILFVQDLLALINDHCHSLTIRHIHQERLSHCEGLIQTPLNRLVCDFIQYLPYTSVIVRGIVPSVNAVNAIKPERHLR